MKVTELIEKISNKGFDLKKELEVKEYLPIELKKTIAQGMIYECTNEEDGTISVDSVQRYMSYVRCMITAHTNLEYTDEDYDTLCSSKYGDCTLLNAIMECFGDDAKECSRIFNLTMDDYMQKMSIEFTIARFLNELSESISNLSKKIGNVDFQSMLPDDVDMSKLGAFLQNYIK